MAVHDVHVQPRHGRLDRRDLVAEPGEVGRQDGRREHAGRGAPRLQCGRGRGRRRVRPRLLPRWDRPRRRRGPRWRGTSRRCRRGPGAAGAAPPSCQAGAERVLGPLDDAGGLGGGPGAHRVGQPSARAHLRRGAATSGHLQVGQRRRRPPACAATAPRGGVGRSRAPCTGRRPGRRPRAGPARPSRPSPTSDLDVHADAAGDLPDLRGPVLVQLDGGDVPGRAGQRRQVRWSCRRARRTGPAPGPRPGTAVAATTSIDASSWGTARPSATPARRRGSAPGARTPSGAWACGRRRRRRRRAARRAGRRGRPRPAASGPAGRCRRRAGRRVRVEARARPGAPRRPTRGGRWSAPGARPGRSSGSGHGSVVEPRGRAPRSTPLTNPPAPLARPAGRPRGPARRWCPRRRGPGTCMRHSCSAPRRSIRRRARLDVGQRPRQDAASSQSSVPCPPHRVVGQVGGEARGRGSSGRSATASGTAVVDHAPSSSTAASAASAARRAGRPRRPVRPASVTRPAESRARGGGR